MMMSNGHARRTLRDLLPRGAFMAAVLAVLSWSSDAQARGEGFLGKFFKPKTITTYAKVVATRPGVKTTCFPDELRHALTKIQKHFGKNQIQVSSGFRSKRENRRRGGANRSYHIRCMAADIRIKGVGKHKLARFARSMSGVGGVGTYSCNGIVHVDVGPKRSWHKRCGRRR